MPIFRRRESAPAPAPKATAPTESVTFDDLVGDARAHQFVASLTSGEWKVAHDYCEQLTDWDARNFYAGALATVDHFPDAWVDETSGAQFPLLVRGAHRTIQAWKVRGSSKAEAVDPASWGTFYAMLNDAEQDLNAAAELLPEDPSPWARLIPTAMGLELPKDTLLARFREANTRSPGFYSAHVSVITGTAKKWGGSHELMFDIAHEADRTLPPGSAGRVATCVAHFERNQYTRLWDGGEDAARSYYKDADVYTDIEGAAARSVLSSENVPSIVSPFLWSHFAYALMFTSDAVPNDLVGAGHLFNLLDRVGVPSTPWSHRYGGAGGRVYASLRELCRTKLAATHDGTMPLP